MRRVREPQPRRRNAGKIQAQYPWADHPCCVCSATKRWYNHWWTQANGRWFCYTHSPKRAQAILASYSNGSIHNVGGPYTTTIRGGKEYTTFLNPGREPQRPDRATCERILKLAGMTVPERKPAKPKKKPRDRRYVR